MAPNSKSPKSQKPKSKPVSEDTLGRLPSKYAKDLFTSHTQYRNPLPERGITQKSLSLTSTDIFKSLQWEKLTKQPPYILPNLTREFYAGIPEKKGKEEPTFSVVRGRLVAFSAERINEVLCLPEVEETLGNIMARASDWDMGSMLRVLCIPGTEWVKEDPNPLRVKRTQLKPFLRSLSLWVMSTVLPTRHNLYWHKERMFLLKAMLGHTQINLGQLIEREILACARRSSGPLFYPNLIRLLCEAEDVPRCDQEEEDFPMDSEVVLSSCEEPTERKMEEEKKENRGEATKETPAEENPQGLAEVVLLLQQHILKQEAVWVFLKAASEWVIQGQEKSTGPPPVFPDWVLPEAGPSGHAHSKPAEPQPTPCPAADKEQAVKEKEPVLIESDKEEESEKKNEGSTSSSSPVSSVGGVNSAGKEEATEERERESKSKNDEERKNASAGKSAATASSPCKKRKAPAEASPAAVPSHLPPRSAWTRRKVCATRPPRKQRLMMMLEESDEEEE